jgi:hypothetical protein
MSKIRRIPANSILRASEKELSDFFKRTNLGTLVFVEEVARLKSANERNLASTHFFQVHNGLARLSNLLRDRDCKIKILNVIEAEIRLPDSTHSDLTRALRKVIQHKSEKPFILLKEPITNFCMNSVNVIGLSIRDFKSHPEIKVSELPILLPNFDFASSTI